MKQPKRRPITGPVVQRVVRNRMFQDSSASDAKGVQWPSEWLGFGPPELVSKCFDQPRNIQWLNVFLGAQHVSPFSTDRQPAMRLWKPPLLQVRLREQGPHVIPCHTGPFKVTILEILYLYKSQRGETPNGPNGLLHAEFTLNSP